MRQWAVAIVVAIATVLGGVATISAQENRMSLAEAIRGFEAASHTTFRGAPDDWTTHHVIFSQPEAGSSAEARVQQDPRYWLQRIRLLSSDALSPDAEATADAAAAKRKLRAPRRIRRDWAVSMGSGATSGAGTFAAKFPLSTVGSSNCGTDFVVYNTGLAGSKTQASIVAFNNLYKSPTCSGTVPGTYWAFNTGGTIVTSVVLSLEGTQIAFVQTTAGKASLVVLKWAAGGTITAPGTPTQSASYPSCTAPCMITLPFNGSPNDTTSSPFWDPGGSDTAFVGDSVGKLHKFSPVFGGGTPAEITSGGFPVTVSQSMPAQALASPVYDSGTGQVFVGDGHTAGGSNDGEVHAVLASNGTISNSAATICHGIGYTDGPLLDPSAGELYFSCGNDHGGGAACPSGNACVRQFPENFASGSAGTPESLGTGADAHIFPGAFDNIYQTSASASSPTGNLYVCGNPGGDPTLYRVPIASNAIGVPVTITALTTKGTNCAPVSEFFNSTTSTDWLFLGVSASGNRTGCSGACVYSFNATSALTAGTNATSGLAAAAGPSGIIVDNIGAAASTVANIYLSTLGNQACTGGTGGCAEQATQSGLM